MHRLNKLAYILLGWAIIIAIIVVASTGFRDVPLSVATYAVAAAVSILPASLIAVVSLTLARASTDLASRNALVRRMDAIEALAGVENVCSDKTGTLTVGRMVVRKFWVPVVDSRANEDAPLDTATGQSYSFETGSDPFYPRGEVRFELRKLNNSKSHTLDLGAKPPQRSATRDELDDEARAVHPDELEGNLRELALCAALCNQATLHRPSEENAQWEANGDPTEVALQVAAHKLGHGKPSLTHAHASLARTQSVSSAHRASVAGHAGHYEQLVEHPFDSTVKRMSIAYRFVPDDGSSGHVVCLMKGAVERVMERCTGVLAEGSAEIGPQGMTDINNRVEELAEQGLRVLALCGKKIPVKEAETVRSMPRDEFERGFGFLGLAGIYDPPRKESAGAVADCLRAGITPRMLTGDHPATATAIALSIGILDKAYGKNAVMTGQQFDAMSDEQVDQLPELPLVVARCAPETKVWQIACRRR